MNSDPASNGSYSDDSQHPNARWLASFTLIAAAFLWFRYKETWYPARENELPEPKMVNALQTDKSGSLPVDLLYQDPVPQYVKIEDDEPVAEEPPATQASETHTEWIVWLAADTQRDNIDRIQRVFSRRNIQILLEDPGMTYIACVRFQTRAEAERELRDLQLHQSDLDQFGVRPELRQIEVQ